MNAIQTLTFWLSVHNLRSKGTSNSHSITSFMQWFKILPVFALVTKSHQSQNERTLFNSFQIYLLIPFHQYPSEEPLLICLFWPCIILHNAINSVGSVSTLQYDANISNGAPITFFWYYILIHWICHSVRIERNGIGSVLLVVFLQSFCPQSWRCQGAQF